MEEYVPKKVEDYLREIDYSHEEVYVPSDFALEFINFIKLVNGSEGEENLTPVLHYKMLDMVRGDRSNIVNMLFRGSAKTTMLGEYLFLYLAVYGSIPDFGKVNLALYVSDSIENGVKNMRKNLEYRWENSEFLRQYIPTTRFTDVRWEFVNIDGNRLIVKGFGARTGVRGPLALDELVYTDTCTKTIAEIQEGEYVFTPYGYSTKVIGKSEVFYDPMYSLSFADGRELKANLTHIHPLYKYKEKYTDGKRIRYPSLVHVTSKELLNVILKKGTASKYFTKIPDPVEFSTKQFSLSPYLLGLTLGDGYVPYGKGLKISGLQEDIESYENYLSEYEYSEVLFKESSGTLMKRISFHGLTNTLKSLGIAGVHGEDKFIPSEYHFGDIQQRKALLAGLLDTDGSCSKKGRITFSNISKKLAEGTAELARGLGYYVSWSTRSAKENRKELYQLYIRGLDNPFRLPRKQARWKLPVKFKGLIPLVSIERINDEPSQCIRVEDAEHQFITSGMLATHNSKEMGVRPNLAILDDLVSDEDARSATVIASIEDTVYKAIDYALHPTRAKTIWSGTPFNSRDPLYKAVESGAWYVNVYPVCEQFPCSKEEFNGAWEDRFTYKYVNDKYTKALKAGKIDTFNQELLLQIMSDSDRLIQDSDINWYKRASVLNNKGMFNFYITTDFATSEKTSADFSVIFVWAYNNNGDFFWVDGICKKQLMDKNIDDLFRLAQMYKPQQVGIEVTGQQG